MLLPLLATVFTAATLLPTAAACAPVAAKPRPKARATARKILFIFSLPRFRFTLPSLVCLRPRRTTPNAMATNAARTHHGPPTHFEYWAGTRHIHGSPLN